MKTIAVTINKGGAGKTMISRSLATAAARAGLKLHGRTDRDKQREQQRKQDA